jgi:hypothetical protein
MGQIWRSEGSGGRAVTVGNQSLGDKVIKAMGVLRCGGKGEACPLHLT